MPVTLVTGSRSGIGAAIAALLARDGHQVIGVDLRDADIEGDLSTKAGRAAVLEQALARCAGRLDHLVLCAGLGPHVEPPTLAVSVNYFGALDLLDGLLPALRGGHQPSAVVISSVVSSMLPWEHNPLGAALEAGDESSAHAIVLGAGSAGGNLAYSGSKNALTVALRRRAPAWGDAGVRLNSVAPGITDTPLLQAGLDDPRYRDGIAGFQAPLGRRARPDEIAAAAAFLLGPAASYVHGSQLFVDGGSDAAARPTGF